MNNGAASRVEENERQATMALFYGQAVTAKYLGPSNTRGARIAVSAQAGRMVVPWDDALNRDENFAHAIELFVRRWEWWGAWTLGAARDGSTVACRTLAYHPRTGEEPTPEEVYRLHHLARTAGGVIVVLPVAGE